MSPLRNLYPISHKIYLTSHESNAFPMSAPFPFSLLHTLMLTRVTQSQACNTNTEKVFLLCQVTGKRFQLDSSLWAC